MSAEIISFTQHRQMAIRAQRNPERKNMHSLVFRSRSVILEVDDATLLNDVCFDFEKASRKLASLRQHLKSFKERTAHEIQMLMLVEAKLSRAVDTARLAKGGQQHEAPSPITPGT